MGENGSMALLINGKKGPVSFLTKGKRGTMVFQLNGKKGPNAFQCFWLLSFQNRDGRPVRSKQANQPQEKRGSISRTHWEVGLPWGRQVVVIFFSSTFTFLIFDFFFLLFKRWTTRRDQEREISGPASLLQSWHWVLFFSTFDNLVYLWGWGAHLSQAAKPIIRHQGSKLEIESLVKPFSSEFWNMMRPI